jgi:radical SAM superfamily enzyme YgiQ (UPF0313 family)
MKVVLVNPPITTRIETVSKLGLRAPPLGLAYLGAMLEKENVDVTIIDAAVKEMSHSDVEEMLRSLNPDAIGVTSTTATINDALKTVTIAKQQCPQAVTVLGGCHVTFMPSETLASCPALDIGVMGEGEVTMSEIAKALKENTRFSAIDGIVYRKDGQIVVNKSRALIENLDAIPFPARHLLPMSRYTVLGQKTVLASMITSRGCPFHCIFCSSSLMYGKQFRSRSPENVVDEIEEIVTKYKTHALEFLDDTFTVNKHRAEEIARQIIQRKLDVRWIFGSRADLITKDLLNVFKKAGCYMFYLGVESGSERVLKTLKKGISLQQVRDALRAAREVGIEVTGSFIFGSPDETKADAMATINFAREAGFDFAQFTSMTPYPGTEVYELAKRDGLIMTEDWSKFTTIEPVMRTRQLDVKQISKLIFKAYKNFYLRGSFLTKQIMKGRFKIMIHVAKNYLLPS